MATNTQAKLEANARYDAKTYTKVMIALRMEDDADIIEAWEEAKEHGYTGREWIRALYDARKE